MSMEEDRYIKYKNTRALFQIFLTFRKRRKMSLATKKRCIKYERLTSCIRKEITKRAGVAWSFLFRNNRNMTDGYSCILRRIQKLVYSVSFPLFFYREKGRRFNVSEIHWEFFNRVMDTKSIRHTQHG